MQLFDTEPNQICAIALQHHTALASSKPKTQSGVMIMQVEEAERINMSTMGTRCVLKMCLSHDHISISIIYNFATSHPFNRVCQTRF